MTEIRDLSSTSASVALRPAMPLLWSKHGIVLEKQEAFAWAIACYRRAIELDPSRVEDRCRLARCQAATGDYSGALDVYRAAFKQLPSSATPFNRVLAEASAIALAAATKSKEREDARFAVREEARVWLTESLRRWQQLVETDPNQYSIPALEAVQSWTRDMRFEAVRDKKAMSGLSAGEQADWMVLWNDVGKLERAAAAGRPKLPPGLNLNLVDPGQKIPKPIPPSRMK